MGLGDITGIFSRYFVVGFFLPAYVGLVSLWLFASSDLIPDALASYDSEATQLLILGGFALVVGLALSGCSYLITRAFEGYPLLRLLDRRIMGLVPRAAIAAQRRRFRRLRAVRDDAGKPQSDRNQAAWCLEKYFPHEESKLLPTRIGNALRAFEQHSNARWGLDGITIWPRIEALLSSEERETHVNAQIDFYVFMNGALVAYLVGVALVYDKAFNVSHPASQWPLYALPFVIGYIVYRAALPPAVNWGDAVRTSIDLHRLDLYEKLGVRAPSSFSDEREMAKHINKALLYGRPLLSDDLWRADKSEPEKPADQQGLLAEFAEAIFNRKER
jgi:hypothetical protein